MDNPAWILVPWAVFAVAALLKVWQITGSVRARLGGTTPNTERFRQRLERIWARDGLGQR